MKSYIRIESIKGLEVFDSRGNPTVQVEVELDGGYVGRAIVPSGASTGTFEAVELRDGNINRLMGKGVLDAVENVDYDINEELEGENAYNQLEIDNLLINLDGTENKAVLGANATLGTSLAVAKAAASSLGMSLYNYIGGINAKKLPIPMMNILNGGKHSDNNINIQEFMIVPIGAKDFRECMEIGVTVYHNLKNILNKNGYTTSVGDEGGFAPNFEQDDLPDELSLKLIVEAIEKSGYIPGEQVAIALDIASTEMFEQAKKKGEEGYYFWKSNILKTTDEMINYLEYLVGEYPIVSIEDGLAEDDWEGWKELTKRLGDKIQLVGDDVFVTNTKRLQKGIDLGVANAILVKPNQIGTLSETLETIELARTNGYGVIISHRSGETEDTSIADIAVATNAGQIKTGAPCRTDRVAKYNRLLSIERDISY